MIERHKRIALGAAYSAKPDFHRTNSAACATIRTFAALSSVRDLAVNHTHSTVNFSTVSPDAGPFVRSLHQTANEVEFSSAFLRRVFQATLS